MAAPHRTGIWLRHRRACRHALLRAFSLSRADRRPQNARRPDNHRARRTSSSKHPPGGMVPKTAWGDPDLQGTWPISYVGSVPLERCAGGFGRSRRNSAASVRSEQSVSHGRRIQGARGRGRRTRRSLCGRDQGGQLRRRVPGRHRRSDGAAAADLVDCRPAEWPAAGDDRGRQAAVGAHEKQLGAAGRNADVRLRVRFRHVGSLHHARDARVDVPLPLQQRRADHPGARIRDPQHGDDPRGAHRADRRPSDVSRDHAVARRVARTLGRAPRS